MKFTRSARVTTVLAATALFATACGDGGGDAGAGGEAGGGEGGGESYSIGISQYTTHPSLDQAREGFMQAFEEAGAEVEWDEQNAQADQGTANNIAGTFAGANLDLVGAIATPTAQTAAQAITDTPVVFMAVTDPEAAELVESAEEPGGNVTGMSDLNPVREQIELLTQVDPDVQRVGIVYSSGEANSAVQVEEAQQAADEFGLEIQEAAVTNSSEVTQGLQSLDVDAIYVPTDNQVVSALETVLQYGADEQIPVVAAEGDSVERGAVATVGLDYHQHGRMAGEMALEVLQNGADPATMPVGYVQPEDTQLFVNPQAAETMGVELPQELIDEADVVVGQE